jgi:hypothetical protein
MVVDVDVIIIRAFPSLYHFHLVTPAARKWVKKNVSKDADACAKCPNASLRSLDARFIARRHVSRRFSSKNAAIWSGQRRPTSSPSFP